MLPTRQPKKPNTVASRNDQLLIAAGASKRSFGWWNKMGVSNGYNTGLTRNGEYGKNYDAETLRWKREIEKDYSEIKALQKQSKCSFEEASELRRLRNPLPLLYKVRIPPYYF